MLVSFSFADIFPGLGLGALAAGSTKITDHDMYVAAVALEKQVSEEQLASGCVYPPWSTIREVSAKIAAEVAANAYKTGVATNLPQPRICWHTVNQSCTTHWNKGRFLSCNGRVIMKIMKVSGRSSNS